MRSFEKRKTESHPSSTFFSPKIQKKLKTGAVGDKYEVEADKVADKIVNKNANGTNGLFQSKKEEEVQQKPISESITSVQSKEMKEEEPVQKKEMKEEEPVQKKEEEEPVQKKEMKEEEPVQKKEEEEPVQKKEKEEEPVQKKEEEEPVQAKCDDCEKEDKVQKKGKEEEEKPVQAKSNAVEKKSEKNSLENKLGDSKGSGNTMDKVTKNEMEAGFGSDFSNVKVHTDTNAVKMSQEIGAQAFTHGNDIYFNKGKYNPDSKEGKRLLAHELTHTIQQGNKSNAVQSFVKDDGWRYSPPATVKRSIKEIQAIVGTSPDGVYGTNTKIAVENYQKKLAAQGLYTDTIDGKWGKNTESAHVSFSLGVEAETYNCSGLAFKTFIKIGLTDTKKILSSMTALSKPTDTCNPREHKFWFWEYTLTITDNSTGASTSSPDFHIVGGQTDEKGNDPTSVMSKNGGRPVKGPGTAMSWQPPASEIATKSNHKETVIPNTIKTRTNMTLKCFCSKKLP